MNYVDFLSNKVKRHDSTGFLLPIESINNNLFDWQKVIVRWALFQGRAALFEDCGLGKTPQQLEWAMQVHRKTGGNVLILAPLAVAQQTKREADKFGIGPVTVCRKQPDARTGINITNYEMIDHFDAGSFDGVVLDESSCLKAYTGAVKTKLMEMFRATKYKLVCTATPAPNDLMEILNQADFLGIMPSNEALARWFINDTMAFGSYRLKKHAIKDFWGWVQSWAVWINTPSDIGYPDDGYQLPEIETTVHVIEKAHDFKNGQLFAVDTLNATNLYREMRETAEARCAKAAEIINPKDESWIIWCNTNDESQRLSTGIDGAVELTGSMDVRKKEAILESFGNGSIKRLVSKPSICGWGLNWQHINHQISVGINFSFEQKYQALKRIHRFGQKKTVYDHVVISETERNVLDIVMQKANNNAKFQALMKTDIDKYINPTAYSLKLKSARGYEKINLPEWLRAA